MAYLLIPLGRGGGGGSSYHGGVRNGGLRWPEWTSESDRSVSLQRLQLLLPLPKTTAELWHRGGTFGDDRVVQGVRSW